MFKKISLILFLSILLASFLFIRHYWSGKSEQPLLVDRLPSADFLIRANVLDVARETSGMLHYNKLPFRDFFSQEFLLGQAKSYGINLQRPVYLFANESGSWGALLHISDSSKVNSGLSRLNKIKQSVDTIFYKEKVYYWPKENFYLSYGKDFLFVYKGNNFQKRFFRILNAKRGKTEPVWKDFLSMKRFRKENLVLFANFTRLKKYGIERAVFAHNSDSTSFTMLSYVRSSKPLNFSQKKAGLSLEENYFASKYLNLHLNIADFRNHPEDPLYRLMSKLSRKISFPLAEFLAAWEGDLSFRQGGKQKVTESFIETELDENFELSEVVKMRETFVPGFSLALSMNERGTSFMTTVLRKGILTKEKEQFRFLGSPALNYSRIQNYYVFSSSENRPRLIGNEQNNGVLSEKGTKFEFRLDSLKYREAFGKVHFPVRRLIERNKFF